MSLGGTGLAIAAFLYLLPLAALILVVRRVLKRADLAAEEDEAEPPSQEEYLTIREETSREENAR